LTVGYEAQSIPVDDDVYLVNILVKTIKKMAKTDNVTKENAVPKLLAIAIIIDLRICPTIAPLSSGNFAFIYET
jgi:hypothetical protein